MSYQHQQPVSSTLLETTKKLNRQLMTIACCPREYDQIKYALRERGEVFDLTHLYDPDDELNF